MNSDEQYEKLYPRADALPRHYSKYERKRPKLTTATGSSIIGLDLSRFRRHRVTLQFRRVHVRGQFNVHKQELLLAAAQNLSP